MGEGLELIPLVTALTPPLAFPSITFLVIELGHSVLRDADVFLVTA